MIDKMIDIKKTINFVKSCEDKEGGFGNFVHDEGGVDSTVAGIEIFNVLNAKIENREKHIKFLKKCQNPDGGFGRKINDVSAIDYTCSAVAALYELGDYPENVKGMVNFVNLCKNPDGGFGRTPGSPSDLDSTISAIAALRIVGEIYYTKEIINYIKSLYAESENFAFYKPNPTGKGNVEYTNLALMGYDMCGIEEEQEKRKKIINFTLRCQNEDGGFGEIPGYPSNIDYSYSALEILSKFNVKLKYNAMEFVKKCYNEDGGFGFIPGTSSKVEYTYYGISCLNYLKFLELDK